MKIQKPYLLFDAGGTLVFPDQNYLKREAAKHDIHLNDRQLYEGYYQLIYRLDVRARSKRHRLPRVPWPKGYAHALLDTLGLSTPAAEAVAAAARVQHRCRNLWTFTFDWVAAVLADLAGRDYRMSILSNSDGRTRDVFKDLGLDGFFERIFDSTEMGIAKPNGNVFKRALADLEMEPAEVLYIGDMYEVDVRGANRAGIGAIHLDPLHLYDTTEWPGEHIEDIRGLPSWLETYEQAPSKCHLFPVGLARHRRGALRGEPINRPHHSSDGWTRSSHSMSYRVTDLSASLSPIAGYGPPTKYISV